MLAVLLLIIMNL